MAQVCWKTPWEEEEGLCTGQGSEGQQVGKAAACCAKVFIAFRDLLLPPVPSHP